MQNRYVKFRVRDKDTKQVVGYEALFPTDPQNTNYEWAQSVNGIYWKNGVIEGAGLQREQFIGVFDKDGKEIYQWDILKSDWNEKVNPIEDIREWQWLVSDGWLAGQENGDTLVAATVIGNVAENPDLL